VHKLPLFLLNSVLIPGAYLQLRVFEPRYLEMVKQSLKNNQPFGICLIRKGQEVGPAAEPHAVGTLAEIIRWDMEVLGVLQITVRGNQRFDVVNHAIDDSQLVIADVNDISDDRPMALAEDYRKLPLVLEGLFSDANVIIEDPEMFEDAIWIAWRLAEYLPLASTTKQQILECENPQDRLELLMQEIIKLESS